MRKKLSLIFIIAFVLALIPMTVFADETEETIEFEDATTAEEETLSEETLASVLEGNSELMAKIPVDEITLGRPVSSNLYIRGTDENGDKTLLGIESFINYFYNSEIEALYPDAKDAVDYICRGCTTDLQKLKRLTTWTENNVEYQYAKVPTSYMDGPFRMILYPEYRQANCMGMTQLIQTMLWLEDIPSVNLYVGRVNSSNFVHSVGAAYIDGEWYYFDGTIGEVSTTKPCYSWPKIYQINFDDTNDYSYVIRRESGLVNMTSFEKNWGSFEVKDVEIPSFVEEVYTTMKNMLSYTDLTSQGNEITSVKAKKGTYGASVIEEISTCYEEDDDYVIGRPRHSYGEYEVIKEPTCQEKGCKEKKCEYCGDAVQMNIAKVDHDYVLTEEKDATCTEDGYTQYNCKYCDLEKIDMITKTGHQPGELIEEIPATCTSEGVAAHYVCEACGAYLSALNSAYEITDLTIAMTDHVYDQEVVDEKYLKSEATEYMPAVYYKSCVCGAVGGDGYTFTVGDPLEAHEHDYSGDWVYDSLAHWKVCTAEDCDEIDERAGHSWVSTDEGWVCSVCGMNENENHTHRFSDEYEYDAAAHWKRCSVTGCTYTQDPEEHTWDDSGVCVCGLTKEEAAELSEEHVHDYSSEWTSDGDTHWHACSGCSEVSGQANHIWIAESITSATCTTAGQETYYCMICGRTKTIETEALGHDYSTEIVTEATCETEGTVYKRCSRCKKNILSESTPALGHTWGEGTTVEATCTSAGQTTKTCETCGKTETTVIAALGHSWSEYTIDKEATCEEKGSKSRICERCGKTNIAAIPMVDHTYMVWEVVKQPTEISKGLKRRECAYCGVAETKTIAMLSPTLPSVTLSKVTAAKKYATVKWKKLSTKNQKKVAKIQIQYSLDKTFKTGVKTVAAKKSLASKKITGLKSNKIYYFRIRTYKKASGKVHISKWSTIKKVKVK